MESVCVREIKFDSALSQVPVQSTFRPVTYTKNPFKECMTEKYDEWLATGKHEFTDGGNMKPVPRRAVVQWVVPVWKDVKSKMVANSFKRYAVKTK